MNNPIKLFENQVSGKSAKFIDSQGKFIYKKLSKKQLQFYLFMQGCQVSRSQYQFRKHIPMFMGKQKIQTTEIPHHADSTSRKGQWINHILDRNRNKAIKEWIILQNLQKGFKHPCAMDIKLGKKKQKKSSNKKFQQSTTNSHNFRINGLSNLFVQKDQPHFISKYYFQKTLEQEIGAHLAFFFFDGKKIDLNLLSSCVQQIKEIVLSLLSFKRGNFDSASLLLLYDAYDHSKFKVKIIDFDKSYVDESQYQESSDQNIIVGLKYIIWYLNQIKEQHQKHEKMFKQQKIRIFDNIEVVPAQKIAQFSQKNPQSLKQLQQRSQ